MPGIVTGPQPQARLIYTGWASECPPGCVTGTEHVKTAG